MSALPPPLAAAVLDALSHRLEREGAMLAAAPGVLAHRFAEIQAIDAIAQCLRETARLIVTEDPAARSDLEVFVGVLDSVRPLRDEATAKAA